MVARKSTEILIALMATKIWFFFSSSRSLHCDWKSWSFKRRPKFYRPNHFLFLSLHCDQGFWPIATKTLHLLGGDWNSANLSTRFFFLVLHYNSGFWTNCNLGRLCGDQNSVNLSTFFGLLHCNHVLDLLWPKILVAQVAIKV